MTAYTIFYSDFAKQDIKESVDYYDNVGAGISEEFVTDVLDMVDRIATHPMSGTIRHRDVRSRKLNRFPCMIHYSILEDEKSIVIEAVYNTFREDFWNS